MTTLADLRALAEQASANHPGGWTWIGRDAAFLGACSPEVIKALVAVAEAAEARLRAGPNEIVSAMRALESALDALKAVLS